MFRLSHGRLDNVYAAWRKTADVCWVVCLVVVAAGRYGGSVLSLCGQCWGVWGPRNRFSRPLAFHPLARVSTSAGTAAVRRPGLRRFSLSLTLGAFGRGIFSPALPRLFLEGMGGGVCFVQLVSPGYGLVGGLHFWFQLATLVVASLGLGWVGYCYFHPQPYLLFSAPPLWYPAGFHSLLLPSFSYAGAWDKLSSYFVGRYVYTVFQTCSTYYLYHT